MLISKTIIYIFTVALSVQLIISGIENFKEFSEAGSTRSLLIGILCVAFLVINIIVVIYVKRYKPSRK